jgi:uncharacterized repeat protein (TIGR01451 family)
MLKKLRSRFMAPSRRTRTPRELNTARQLRRLRMETLEDRHLLTLGLGADQSITVAAGAPLQIPIHATESDSNATLTYSVTPTSGTAITGTLPTGNPDLVLNITHTGGGSGDPSFSGTMTIELYKNFAPNIVAQIVSLVNAGKYNNTSFYRIADFDANATQPFVIQGGLSSGAVNVPTVDDEFNALLRYTSEGVVGLARQTNHDTGSSEFFISADPVANPGVATALDYNYAIFGRIVSDPSGLRALIQSVPHQKNQQGAADGAPITPVTITSATIVNDNNDLALIVSAASGTAANTTGDVTVTVTDSDGNSAQQVFHVTTATDPGDPPPFLNPITPPSTAVNTPATFQLTAFDNHGDPVVFYGPTELQQFAQFGVGPTQTISSHLQFNVNPSTGAVTVTPDATVVPGVQPMFFGVAKAPNSPISALPDTQMVPLFIDPAAPTSVVLKSSSSPSNATTLLNNSDSGRELTFTVSGVTPGDTVEILNVNDPTNSIVIGSVVAPASSAATETVDVTTDGMHGLKNGDYKITAVQILKNQSYHVGNSSGTTDLTSPTSTQVFNLHVAAGTPNFTSVPLKVAQAGQVYSYTVMAVDTGAGGLQFSLSHRPVGMSNPDSNHVITWTPPANTADGTVVPVTVHVIDTAGNTADQTFNITVFAAPVVTSVSSTAAANSGFQTGGIVPITVTFSSAVTVDPTGGRPTLTLNDGGIASYVSGSGGTTLTFNYTVGGSEKTAKLDYSSTSALALNGGTIVDGGSNAAVLTLPDTGTDGLAALDIVIGLNADLSVTITPSATTAIVGGSIGYTIVVTNNGPSPATNFKLTDTLPASLVFGKQIEQSGGPAFTLGNSGNAITDTISSLASGASATFTVIADVAQTVANSTAISNTATVSSDLPDNTTTNNSATATTTAKLTGIMLSPDSLDPTKMQLTVGGTAGIDSITFLPAAGGKVSVNMNGHMNGPFAVNGRLVALGQAGNDWITVSSAIKLPAYLYGGSGNNQLTGGSGDNVLVGGSGANTLIGGTARNLLIGGTGPAKLFSTKQGLRVGSTSGSILVGGSTDFDQNDVALATIMQEWDSTDAYATRISKIKGGTLTGGVAFTSTTVHQPSAHVVDQLYASTGFDWFLAPSVFDQLFGIDPHKNPQIKIN